MLPASRIIGIIVDAARLIEPFVDLPEPVRRFYPEADAIIERFRKLVSDAREAMSIEDAATLDERLRAARAEITAASADLRAAAQDRLASGR